MQSSIPAEMGRGHLNCGKLQYLGHFEFRQVRLLSRNCVKRIAQIRVQEFLGIKRKIASQGTLARARTPVRQAIPRGLCSKSCPNDHTKSRRTTSNKKEQHRMVHLMYIDSSF